MSHEEELLKAAAFDQYYFKKAIRFRYNGIEIYGMRFRKFSKFFSDIYAEVIAASSDQKVFDNIHQIGFLNTVRNDPRLIGLEAWEQILRRLDNKTVTLQDIIEWLKDIELLKANVNVNVNVNAMENLSLRW